MGVVVMMGVEIVKMIGSLVAERAKVGNMQQYFHGFIITLSLFGCSEGELHKIENCDLISLKYSLQWNYWNNVWI